MSGLKEASRIKRVATIALIIAALASSYHLVKMGAIIFQIYESVFGARAEIESITLENFHGDNSSIGILISIDNPSHGSLTLNRIEIFLYLNDEFLYRYVNYRERVVQPLTQENISLNVLIHDPQALEKVSEAFEEDRWEWSAQGEVGFKTVLGSFLRKLEY